MRDIDPDLLAAFDGVFRPVVAVWLDWPGGAARYHSRLGLLTLDGEDWRGVGDLGSIQGLEESDGLQVRELVVGLTGMLADQIVKVRGAQIRNRAAAVYMGAVDENEQQIGQLLRLFSGEMRALSVQIRDAKAVEFSHMIEVIIRNHFDAVRRPIEVRLEHPRLPALQDQTLQWPA